MHSLNLPPNFPNVQRYKVTRTLHKQVRFYRSPHTSFILSQMHILHIKKNTFHTLSIEAHTQTINSSLVLFFFSLNNLTHSFFLTFLLLSFLLDMGENK